MEDATGVIAASLFSTRSPNHTCADPMVDEQVNEKERGELFDVHRGMRLQAAALIQ